MKDDGHYESDGRLTKYGAIVLILTFVISSFEKLMSAHTGPSGLLLRVKTFYTKIS